MKRLASLVCFLALGLVVIPPLAFALRSVTDLDRVKMLMLIGTVLWFLAAPIWLRKDA